MNRGFYITANGLLNQQRILNVVANNLANSVTAGYKADTTIPTTFDERLLLAKGKRNGESGRLADGSVLVGNTAQYNSKEIGGNIVYRTIDYQQTDLTQGNLEFTGRALDVALQGNVYFNIEPASALVTGDREGPFFTRDGQFDLDNEGYLVSPGCGRILDEGGNPIQLGTAEFTVDNQGLITTAEGETFQLGFTYVPPEGDVIKLGDNVFAPGTNTEGIGAPPDGEVFDVIQGAYERSNVNLSQVLTKQMEAQRNFESCAQMLKIFDTMNQKAVQELARNR